MGAVTTADEVRAVSGSTLTNPQIDPFIAAAQCLLDGVAACTTGKGVSQDCLDQAAAWLAVHLLSQTAQGQGALVAVEEKFENWSVKRAMGVFSGAGVMTTAYGQTANALAGGCLLEADKAPAQIAFFG